MASTIAPEQGPHEGDVLRVWGPPGTGKTRYLADRVRSTVKQYGPDSLLIASFSTTAAKEIGGRFAGDGAGLRPPDSAIGTLHSHAFRALGNPNVALDSKVLADWNDSVPPELHITPSVRGGGNGGDSGALGVDPAMARTGDELIGALDKLRAAQASPEDWPVNVIEFAERWTDWKRGAGACDFCMDDQTEVFTHRGWMTGDEIREGDLVRSIDPETGLAEWQPVESVYRRRGRTQMIRMVNAVHDSMTTPDHKWLINRRDDQENWSRTWSTTEKLNSTARIIRAATSSDSPEAPKYIDAFVELVAWWFTEGSYHSGRADRGGQISQSHRVNPAYTARIEACLRALCGDPGLRHRGFIRWSASQSEKRGITFFTLGGDLVEELEGAAPNKVPSIDFLAQLTTAQLQLFVNTAMDADGHRARSNGTWTFAQQDRERAEAFAAAASLAGMSVTFAAPRVMGTRANYCVTASSRRLQAVVPGTTGGYAKGTRAVVDYDGLIWCPTVARHHNFFARRNGKTYYTGNTDMIEGALLMAQDGTPAPGRPDFLIFDEAQDMTPLEVALALAWGSQAHKLVLGMDDDQAINRWRGGDPEPLLNLYGEGVQDHVLDRSYRVPEAVRAVAEQWVRRLSLRREKVYHSRIDEAGAVVPGVAQRVQRRIRDMELITDMVAETERGRTVMVIASCNYLLDELIANLRAEGVPFHNPFRPAERRWNPLGEPAREGSVSTVERVRAFLALSDRDWTGADVQSWIELVKLSNAGMVRGAKTAASRFDPREAVPFEDIAALFKDEAMLDLATQPNLDFLEHNLLSSKSDVAKYPLQVARAHGAQALEVTPMITVGTIHSVKGAAADVVYVCPDISGAARHSMSTREGVDDAIRLFYVGMTRAYEELRVLAPATPRHMVTAELIPPELEVFA